MDPPHLKITQTFQVYHSFLGACYSKVVFCFVFNPVFRFGEGNTQLRHLDSLTALIFPFLSVSLSLMIHRDLSPETSFIL